MARKPFTHSPFFGILLALVIVGLASGLRVAFLSELGRNTAYLTYYPALAIAALLGGLSAGLTATVSSALLAGFWIQGGRLSGVETLAMAVFLLSCFIITGMAESMRRARVRAVAAREEAEAANRAKSVFLATMSHELRTPLNAVLGFSRILRDDSSLDGQQREYLGIINRAGDHLLNLINNILDISKIEAGRVELELSDFAPDRLVREVTELLAVRAAEKGLGFVVEQDPDLPAFVRLDQGKLRQVLINLVGNAVKYTRTGEVRIKAGAAKDPGSGTTGLRFEIIDSGSGIGAEDQARLFTPFVRLSPRETDHQGTGLGLAISRQYVELMGGSLTLESVVGRGSTFRVELPYESPAAEGLTSLPWGRLVAGLVPGRAAPRILVAEDQEENRLLLAHILEGIGAETNLVADGKSAVEAFAEWKPDLVFMDIRMPVLDGLEATRRIRALERSRRSPIVALSAHALEAERNEMLAAGCDDVIRKPYRESEIHAALGRFLGLEFRFESAPEALPDKTALDLDRLPRDLLLGLLEASRALDSDRCRELIAAVASIDAGLAHGLELLRGSFSFDLIQSAAEKALSGAAGPHGEAIDGR